MSDNVLIRRSTNIAEVSHLRDRLTGSFPSDAVITGALLDGAGNPVAGADALIFALVAGTDAAPVYRALIADTVNLAAATYTLRITVTKLGAKREFNLTPKILDG